MNDNISRKEGGKLSQEKIDVSVIFVNYNTEKLLQNCIQSIREKTKGLNYELIVVDNASSETSVNFIRENIKNITLIASKENRGFGAGNNLGIPHAGGKYLFFLNCDTILLNNAIKQFYDFMEEHEAEHIGCIGTYLFDKDLKVTNSYGGFHRLFQEIFNRIKKMTRKILRRKKSTPASTTPGETKEVEVIVGADMFVPKNAISECGPFDESFFLYSEENDLQYRMKKKNWKRMIITGPKIIHLEGGSPQNSFRKWNISTVSKIKYFRKHAFILSYLCYKAIVLTSILVMMFIDIFRKKHTAKENTAFLKMCAGEKYIL
ncbi:MAG: glycosyltransferase family 2 protein [Brevinematales bacterium]|nr:glycosyltransferase family 2 protein [Brevinematales bacterium]